MINPRLLVALLLIMPATLWGKPSKRMDRHIVNQTFIPKGQWIVGGNLSYSEHSNDNYKFIVLDNWSGNGYAVNLSPFVGYAFANDLAAGGRFSYDRSLLKIDEMDIDLSSILDGDDLNLEINDYYKVTQTFYATAFLRSYVNLGESKRFALFNDLRLTYGYGQGKLIDGKGTDLTGTYETIHEFQIGINPGLVAFINDFVAVEVNVGVLGFNTKWIDQVTNQVEHGSHRRSSANFKVNLFSIGLGIAFYL